MSSPTRNGFTLFELLVVMVVVGLIMALGIAVYPRITPGLDARTAAREIGAGLRVARNEAMTENREVRFTLDVESGEVRVGLDEAPRRLPGHLGIRLFTARSELVEGKTGSIRFFPDGSSTGGRISIAGGGHSYDVTVNWLTGRIDITE